MPLTGQLGTTRSYLGNLQLGVNPPDIIKSLSNALTVSQILSYTKFKVRNLNQSLSIGQTVTVVVQRFHSGNNSLTITQQVKVNLNLNRSLNNTLVFTNEHYTQNGAGGYITVPNLILTRGGTSNVPCCINGKVVTVFQSATRAIVLPNPEYGDSETPIGAVKIIKTITNKTYSYIKKSKNRKLKYKFRITQRKGYELRQFLLDFLSERIVLINWKGEIWNGNFLTNPSSIVSVMRGDPCIGDLYEVEIDFQGIKVN